MIKKIPLIDFHKRLGATIGEFAGFEIPILYDSIMKEHMAVRSNSGIFDISHMAMFHIKGKDSTKLLEKTVAKKIGETPENMMNGPALILNEKGGIKDDIMLYRIAENEWIMVGNAVNTEKDYEWLTKIAKEEGHDVKIEYMNNEYSLLALQGPESPRIMEKKNKDAIHLKRMEFLVNQKIEGYTAFILSRSGWTGEDGFEIIAKHSEAMKIYESFVREGAKPCGLGARDSLRLEMGFLLYGNDMDENISPIEARYWMGFDYDKENCIGCKALKERIIEGVDKTRMALKFSKKDRFVPRHGMKVTVMGKDIGYITSGGYSPILGRPIAMAYIHTTHSLPGMKVYTEIRGKRHKAKITDFPFLKKH